MGAELKIEKWEALYSQEMSLEKITGTDQWKPIQDLKKLTLPYPPEYAFQYLWLRAEFTVSGNPLEYYGINCGRIYHIDRVFINHTEVGSTLFTEVRAMHYPRSYMIPGGVLVSGKNVLYIQVGIFGGICGGIAGDITIQDRTGFKNEQLYEDIVFQYIPSGLILFHAIAMILLFIFFLLNRHEKIFLYTSMLAAYFLFYLVFTFQVVRFVNVDTLIAFLWSAVPTFAFFTMLMLQTMYRVYLSSYNRVIMPLLAVCIVAPLVTGNELSDYFLGRITGTVCIVILYPFFLYMTVRLNRIKPDPVKYSFFTGTILLTWLHSSYETYNGLTGNYNIALFITYCSPLYITCIIFFIFYDFKKRWMDMELLYSGLKTRGIEPDQPVQITDSTKVKLQQVIDFIDKNYISDISREGLAAAIDMNPDYMSRVFKSYTGKKINDYINEKRIEEAVRRINDSDASITEIAFSVGFDSLTTFNRIFKRVSGTTPSKLRE